MKLNLADRFIHKFLPPKYTIKRYTLPILQKGATPIKILHISDLHLAPWQNSKIAFIQSLTSLAPDLLISTGDHLGHTKSYKALYRALKPFAGVPGAFVFGSNDYYAPVPKNPARYLAKKGTQGHTHGTPLNTKRLKRILEGKLSWINLNNASAYLKIANTRIRLFGTNDAHIGFDDLKKMKKSLATHATFNLSIGVTHAPYGKIVSALAQEGAQLICAGHTHGGQLCLPGQRALVTNCDAPPRMASGMFQSQKTYLHISQGLGQSIYAPVRIFCPPAVSLITLCS